MQEITCTCGQKVIGPEFLRTYHGADLCRDCYAVAARVTEFDRDKVFDNVLKYLDDKRIDNYWYTGIAEPGYNDRTAIGANWNKTPKKLVDFIESKLEVECLWEDEWIRCECGKAVRVQPDSYAWLPSYVMINDCEIICRDCYAAYVGDIIEEFKNDDRKALPDDFQAILEINGWTRGADRYESGWYPGQNDSPAEIAKAIQDKHPELDVIFVLTGKGQFDIHFAVYTKTRED